MYDELEIHKPHFCRYLEPQGFADVIHRSRSLAVPCDFVPKSSSLDTLPSEDEYIG